MQRNVHKQAEKYLRRRKKWKKWQKVVMSMACVVVFCTVYALILPAITANSKTSCGYEEHIHTDKCVEKELICDISEKTSVHTHSDACVEVKKELSCGLEETSGHTHGDGCYVTAQTQVCGLEESEEHTHNDACFQSEQKLNCTQKESDGHTHTDACYKEVSTYICGLEEGQETGKHEHTDKCYKIVDKCDKEEHEHKLACFSDPDADVETREIWERTFEDIELTGDWSEDLIAIAESQLGYEESTENYVVENDKKRGYTRYGEWYGNEYGHWCAMYVSFCLNYAEVEGIPFEAGCQNWINTLSEEPYELYREAKDYTPVRGDLVFFNWDKELDSDHVGIVVEYIEATEYEPAQIKTIEGNASNTVKYKTYDIDDGSIMGYAILPEEPEENIKLADTNITATIYTNGDYKEVAEDDTTITITGPLPKGAEVKAYAVELDVEGQEVIYAYDITIFLKDRSVYEPDEDNPLNVNISSSKYEQEEDDLEPSIYYVPEEGNPEPVGTTIEAEGVSFTAEHFSVYALMAPRAAHLVSTQTQLKNAINQKITDIQLNGNFGVYLDSDEGDGYGYIDGPIIIPANTHITIDLNGHTIWQHGTASFFEIKDGAQLTIIDTANFTINTVKPNGNLYGNTAKVEENSNGASTLTYYVTTSTVSDEAKYLTNEELVQYKVTTKGAIIANNRTVFKVGNGTLNIDGGMIRGGTNRAIDQSNGTVNLNAGYICGFKKEANSTSDDAAFGGAIRMTGGKLNLTGTVLAANTAQNGGAVYAKGKSAVEVTGGVISGNIANRDPNNWEGHSEWHAYHCGGGGVYLGETANITMSGGYITNNVATDDGYFDGGGGVSLTGNSTMVLNGGFVTGNKAQGGGGIRTNYGKATTFTMNGGHVSANMTTDAEGAGIAIDNGGKAYILGGHITNNIIPYTKHWGGGGLFCADGSTLNIEYGLITSNYAGGFGAGVAGCPTGRLYLYVERGCAIYNNDDVRELDGTKDQQPNFVNGGAKDGIDAERCVGEFLTNGHADYFCALQSTVVNEMLGGSFSNWEGSADWKPVQAEKDKSDVLSANNVMGLTSHPSEAGIEVAQNEARVFISGNYSYTHGGGIMCNGNLIVGIPTNIKIPVRLDIQATKSFVSNSGKSLSLKDQQFEFEVVDENGTEIVLGTCDEDGNIRFNNQIALEEAGEYTFYIQERVPDNLEAEIQYDSTKYKLYVKVEQGNHEQWYGETWKTTYKITELRVTKQNGNEEKEIAVNTKTQSGVITVLPENEEQIAFNNIRTDLIDIKVVKKWVGDYSKINTVTVDLYRNGTILETQELNAKNNWEYIWKNLQTKDENGNPYTYHIEEKHVTGYITTYENVNESVIHTVNITNINIDNAKFNLDLTKVSEEEPELTLAGAEFELIDSQGNRISFIGENGVYTASERTGNGTKKTVITVEGGKLLLKEIPAGTYILREIKAPEGYGLMDDVEITLDEFTEPTVELVLEDPEKTYVIPETGGIGTNMFTIGGVLLMMGSLLIGFTVRRKRERGYR